MKNIATRGRWRGAAFLSRLARLKHFRGHGVHSPFVYSIVRNVFMTGKLNPDARSIFDKISSIGIGKRLAIELSNLSLSCNCSTIDIDNLSKSGMSICTPNCSDKQIHQLASGAELNGTPIVILEARKHKAVCEKLIENCHSTSIDRVSYLILLNNHLPKQHFKL